MKPEMETVGNGKIPVYGKNLYLGDGSGRILLISICPFLRSAIGRKFFSTPLHGSTRHQARCVHGERRLLGFTVSMITHHVSHMARGYPFAKQD
jgi:hypothetical protein